MPKHGGVGVSCGRGRSVTFVCGPGVPALGTAVGPIGCVRSGSGGQDFALSLELGDEGLIGQDASALGQLDLDLTSVAGMGGAGDQACADLEAQEGGGSVVRHRVSRHLVALVEARTA